jgi:hypothetical protein
VFFSILDRVVSILSNFNSDDRLSSPFPAFDGRVGNHVGFSFVYEILPFIMASFGCFDLLDGPDHLFDTFPTVSRTSLLILFVFLQFSFSLPPF